MHRAPDTGLDNDAISGEDDTNLIAGAYSVVRTLQRDHRGTVLVVKNIATQAELLCQQILYTRFSSRERRTMEAEINDIMHLEHPYIAPIVDFYVDRSQKTYNIITDTPGFKTVADLITSARNNNTFIPEESVWCLAGQILSALAYCHLPCKSTPNSPSVILHRNIRPTSILVIDERTYKLTAFGIWHFYSNVVAAQSTLSLYMAPEVVFNNVYNEKSDVWELGVVLYELCSKQRPFSGCDRQQIKDSITNGCIRNLPIYYSEDLANFIYSMLNPAVVDRASISDLIMHPKLVGSTQSYDPSITGYDAEQLRKLLQLRTQEIQSLKSSEAHLKTLLSQGTPVSVNSGDAMYINLRDRGSSPATPTHISAAKRASRGGYNQNMLYGSIDPRLVNVSDIPPNPQLEQELERLQRDNMHLTELISSQSQKHEKQLYAMQRSVAYLLVDAQDVDPVTGQTTLMKAAESGLSYIVERFLAKQRRCKDKMGRTALMYAVLGGSIKCVQLLVGEEARLSDFQGKTALAYAIANKDMELISILQSVEWDILIQGKVSVRELALATGREEIINLFPASLFNNVQLPSYTLSTARNGKVIGHNSSNILDDFFTGSKEMHMFSSQEDMPIPDGAAKIEMDNVLGDNSQYLADIIAETAKKGENNDGSESYSYSYSYSSVGSSQSAASFSLDDLI